MTPEADHCNKIKSVFVDDAVIHMLKHPLEFHLRRPYINLVACSADCLVILKK